jgi:predicted nucleotidyltransferase
LIINTLRKIINDGNKNISKEIKKYLAELEKIVLPLRREFCGHKPSKNTTMEKRTDIIDKVKAYKALVLQDFPMRVERVYLFGSYAKGTSHKDSDIDVALVVNHFEGDFFKVVHPLWKLTMDVDHRIEPVVVARDTDYAGFLDEIQRTGIEI